MSTQESLDDSVLITIDPHSDTPSVASSPQPAPPAQPARRSQPLVYAQKTQATQFSHQPAARSAKPAPRKQAPAGSKQDIAAATMLREQILKQCLAVCYRTQAPVRRLGFTSAAAGEGKTFIASIASAALAQQSGRPVTLLDCNWDHPCLHQNFDLPATPGLAEWLRQECTLSDICYQVGDRLTVIPAGDGAHGAIPLLETLRQQGLAQLLDGNEHLLVLDLPSVIASAYGPLAAQLAQALILVVRARATSRGLVTQAGIDLEHLPVEGILLNRVQSNLPRWLRQIL